MRVLGAAFLSCLTLAPLASAASFPPHLRFRTIATREVLVHYHQGLEAQGRKAAALASEILAAHESRYGVRVRPVHIVLADTADDPNGFALPFPYPLVHVRAVPPDGTDEFGNYEGWLRLVLTHELAHIVHLEEARGLLGFGRKVFGRAPFLFPNSLTPGWLIEGLATYEETEGTAFGRGRNPDTRMVLRMAAVEGRFPKEDRASVGLDEWPAGLAPYLFGEAFVRDLETRFGKETLPEIARVHSGRLVPYTDDWTSHTVTAATFHTRWREWRNRSAEAALTETGGIRASGLTPSTAVTERGVRQTGPRFSPDGQWLAYTSRTLTRFTAIRLCRPDGTEDRELVRRNGGASLSWTPGGKGIVFDEAEVYKLFSSFSDLRIVDVATRRVRRLTRGVRGRGPDVAPDGRTVAFVREIGGGSEIAAIGLDGRGLRAITSSPPGTEWSGPRWSPRGDMLVASRWTAGGWLDIVRVDPATGAVTELTHDRAKDVEPAFSPDGQHVVFRSDRDGVSNLYALRLGEGRLFRVTNVVGGAFAPDVAPDGHRVAFADYGARGYDVRVLAFDPASIKPAAAFGDPYPPSRAEPASVAAADRPYRPLPAMLPRFWSPWVSFGDDTKLGAVTAGSDPLFRHAYGFDVHRGLDTGRFGFRGVYQYDRFRPTLLFTGEDTTDPAEEGALLTAKELTVGVSLPVARTLRHAQSVSLTWRRRRETLTGGAQEERFDLGGIEAAYALSSAKRFPFSISPVEGWRLRLACLREDESLGSDVSLSKVTADLRTYTRVFGESDALALRLGGGTTFGRPAFKQSFAVGGFPDASLLDVVRTNVSVLRGYPDSAFRGRSFAHANVEYRVPLAHPQAGWASLPVFVRHLHASALFDAGHAWSEDFRFEDVKTSAGVALGADMVIGHYVPLTVVLGAARGFAEKGETTVYFRTGLAF